MDLADPMGSMDPASLSRFADAVNPADGLTAYDACRLCPRACGVNRAAGERGVCGASSHLRMGRAALHWWEEPPLVGERGSGTIFFSHCPLGCVYCQNADLAAGAGVELPTHASGELGCAETDGPHARFAAEAAWLARVMLRLQDQEGAANINLVTATHYAPHVTTALRMVRGSNQPRLRIPVVWNTSGYESPQVLASLDGLVDVYLADMKYASARTARLLSHAPDCPEASLAALAQMVEQRGPARFDAEGLLVSGVMVRHLVLPGHVDESLRVLELLVPLARAGARLSIMNQFTAVADPRKLARVGLSGAVSDEEYERVLDHADALGIDEYFWQEGGAASESFIPAFDGTGLEA